LPHPIQDTEASVDVDASRLRLGELLAGASAVLLLVFMFFFKWYGLGSSAPDGSVYGTGPFHVASSQNAWHALTIVRWVMLVTAAAALALAILQATRRAPALPAALSVIVTVLGGLTSILLVYRVFINLPGSDKLVDQKIGAVLGVVSTLGITLGGYASMREEGVSPKDAPSEIPTVVPEPR
jgi:hypothetical protein